MRLLPTLLVACVALGTPARAYNFLAPDGSNTKRAADAEKWPDSSMPITWLLDTDGTTRVYTGTTGAQVRQAAIDGFAKWTTAAPRIQVKAPSNLAQSARTARGDGKNELFWVEQGENWQFGSAAIGVTTPWAGNDGYIQDADIQYNSVDYRWQVGTGNYRTCSTCVDTLSIATHEEGHFLGMGHSCEADDIDNGNCANTQMNAVMVAFYDTPKQTLNSDDLAGITTLYPSGTNGGGGGTTITPGDLCGACGANADCTSGACAGTDTFAFCTQACSASRACPTGYSCEAVSGSSTKYCFPTGDCAGNCNAQNPCPDGQECQSGACVYTPAGPGESCATATCVDGYTCVGTSAEDATCAKSCDPARTGQCPTGETCEELGDGNGNGTGEGACFAGGGGGGNGNAGEFDACQVGSDCQAGMLCVGVSETEAVCLIQCQPANPDCPANEECTPLQSGRGACTPVEGGGGGGGGAAGEGESCASTDCGDGLACVTENLETPTCYLPCDPSSPVCPSGEHCVAGSSTGSCQPGAPSGGTADAGTGSGSGTDDGSGGDARSTGCACSGTFAPVAFAVAGLLARRRRKSA